VKTIKIPNADHPILIEPSAARVRVTVAGRVVADTRAALTLRESDYPAVYYVPRTDVDMSLLGDAAYYTITNGGERTKNAVWTYEAPYDAVTGIKDHLAFYSDRVDTVEELPLG